MREILFRGKRIDNGEWVYGDIIHRRYLKNDVVVIRTEDSGFDNYSDYEVDPSTVGQCVPGLTDKNGKKIYEGDILERTNVNGEKYKEYVVAGQWSYKWTHGVYGFSLTDLNGGYMMDLHYTKSYEIIGNIHDNPEILKGE